MAKQNISTIDASKRAASELEYILRGEKKDETPKITVDEAKKQDRVYQADTTRNVTRVLFISQDTSLLNPTRQSLDGFLNLSELFDEVHIVILRQGIPPKNPILRPATNVWIYTASVPHWFMAPLEGIKVINEQLVFAAGFRPDLIVARDPFESAIVAARIAHQYQRPVQLHVLDDFTTADFVKKSKNNFWRQFMPWFTVKYFPSVRAATSNIEMMLSKRFTIPDCSVLPRFHNYDSVTEAAAGINLKEKYKPFVFIMLFIGTLSHQSTLFRVIDAARFVLRNPRVGLVVVGDGPARAEFEKRAKILEVDKQVIFDTQVMDVIPYLKSANLLLVTDVDSDSDEVALQGAAAGIPLIMSRTPQREDIFEHGVSAYLCEEGDSQALTDRINDVLNNIGIRKIFATSAQMMITEKFHQDPHEYREAYRTSLEQALFVEGDNEKKTP